MKIIIFDDDPTGSQTVYGCPLLLNWDEQTLEKAFEKYYGEQVYNYETREDQ